MDRSKEQLLLQRAPVVTWRNMTSCKLSSVIGSKGRTSPQQVVRWTPPIRFVVDLLYTLLYNKSEVLRDRALQIDIYLLTYLHSLFDHVTLIDLPQKFIIGRGHIVA